MVYRHGGLVKESCRKGHDGLQTSLRLIKDQHHCCDKSTVLVLHTLLGLSGMHELCQDGHLESSGGAGECSFGRKHLNL